MGEVDATRSSVCDGVRALARQFSVSSATIVRVRQHQGWHASQLMSTKKEAPKEGSLTGALSNTTHLRAVRLGWVEPNRTGPYKRGDTPVSNEVIRRRAQTGG
jgi:hypothetical protein